MNMEVDYLQTSFSLSLGSTVFTYCQGLLLMLLFSSTFLWELMTEEVTMKWWRKLGYIGTL